MKAQQVKPAVKAMKSEAAQRQQRSKGGTCRNRYRLIP